MSEVKNYIQTLFNQKNIIIATNRAGMFDEYVNDESNINAVKQIQENQKMMMEKWTLKNKVRDIIEKQLIIPNATVGKTYSAKLDFEKHGMRELSFTEFEGLEQYGLSYNNENETVSGVPTRSGDFKIKMKFRVMGEDESAINEKSIALVINADPKSLWKNIPSDDKKDEEWKAKNYWKADDTNEIGQLGDKHVVVASKRGRSHANVGSFRDDHYQFRHYGETGWSIVCVADGAGSAKLSRQGSKIACENTVEYFEEHFKDDTLAKVDELIGNYRSNPSEEHQKQLNIFLYESLGKAAFSTHKKLIEWADHVQCSLKDLHSTLIFALFKKYEFGYAVLSFGVGDCPIGLLSRDKTELKLMNWLDVGEFGGGTRFITMPEIFSSDKFPTRFGFKLIEDFSYLILMTDGIYDPKFVVEANLEKVEKWQEFLADLGGENDDHAKVDFDPANTAMADQLSSWMDFWSPGNHDDRTLAIVF